MRNRPDERVVPGLALLLSLATATSLLAQETSRFEVGGQVPFVRFTDLNSTDTGIGVHLAWRPSSWVGVEGELNFFPNDLRKVKPKVHDACDDLRN